MKISKPYVHRATLEVLALPGAGALTVEAMVRHIYPRAKHPEKKAATFLRHLNRMWKCDYVRPCRGGWIITPAGRKAIEQRLSVERAVQGRGLKLAKGER